MGINPALAIAVTQVTNRQTLKSLLGGRGWWLKRGPWFGGPFFKKVKMIIGYLYQYSDGSLIKIDLQHERKFLKRVRKFKLNIVCRWPVKK